MRHGRFGRSHRRSSRRSTKRLGNYGASRGGIRMS